MAISLLTTVHSTAPDFVNEGFKFFVKAGDVFDADDFASAYKLNRHDIDRQDVHAAQDKSSRLNDGQWLEVSFENE